MSKSRNRHRAAVALAVLGSIGVSAQGSSNPLRAQSDLEVVVERTELRWSSTGRLLGHLLQGTPLERLGGRSGWTRVGVSGWMWRPSLAVSGDQFRITPRRENLRASPNGQILGALERGVEVRRVETRGQWFRIEMIGWLPDETVRDIGTETSEEPVPEAAPESETPPTTTGATRPGRLSEAAPVRLSPRGDDVTSLPEGVPVEVIETRDGWTRVRVEAWVPSRTVARRADGSPSPAEVAASPERYVGRVVVWDVEYVALQRADEWRTDFEAGEVYALARAADDRSQYVYFVVPPALRDVFEALEPFERVRVRAAVRTGSSALTGNPIVTVQEVLP